MERLTERSLDYCTQLCSDEDAISCAFYKGEQEEKCWRANMYDRLAAYEDTGLTPKEVKAKCAWADNVCKMLSGIFEDSGVFDFSHIKELITAEQEGRIVVLPCKPDVTCKHAQGEIYINAIGEACLYCDIWDGQRNISLGECIGNCDCDEAEKAMVSEDA